VDTQSANVEQNAATATSTGLPRIQ